MSESFAKLAKLTNLVDFVKANSVNLAGFAKVNLANLLNFVKLNLADFAVNFARANLAISAVNLLREFITKCEFTSKFNANHKFTHKENLVQNILTQNINSHAKANLTQSVNSHANLAINSLRKFTAKTQIFQANSRKIYSKARIYTQNLQQSTNLHAKFTSIHENSSLSLSR